LQREQIDENHVEAGRGACAAEAGDGATDYEGCGGGRGGADDRADFEDNDCGYEGVFGGKECLLRYTLAKGLVTGGEATNIYLSHWQLECTKGEEITGLIPGNLVEGVELV
jgi:hypothetical protein